MTEFIDLKGGSGQAYRFRIWADGAHHLPIAGNYVCAKAGADGLTVLCVGESEDLSQLRTELAKPTLRATTHVFTRLNVSRAVRTAEHQDLAATHKVTPVRERAG